MKKVFLEDLPKSKSGKSVNWIRCAELKCRVRFIYYDIEGYIEIVGYKNEILIIKYLDKEPFKIAISGFKNCNFGGLLGIITNEFRIKIGQTFKDNKRDITIIDRKYIKDNKGKNIKHYKFRCNKCGFECGEHYRSGEFKEEHWIQEGHLYEGNGCSCCCSSPQIVVPHINSIVTTDPWMVKWFQGGYDEAKMYTAKSNLKIQPKCSDCGITKDKEMRINTIYNNKSIGCSCGDGFSYGHKYIFSLLDQLNLDFKDNETFDWCKFYNPFKNKTVIGEYDFVIEDLNLIVEVDGDWHRKDNNLSGQKKEESELLDKEKDRLAKEHGHKEVIRISDEDSIKNNIINSELNNIFNLSNIDWMKCEEFALSNKVKEACKLKRDNPNMSTREIGRIMSMNHTTIIKYLKKGTKLGWCEYNGKEEIIKSGKNGKPVEIFKDEISLGIFESAKELTKKSKELFGVKLGYGKILETAKGYQSIYKGFVFKYIE